MICPKCDAQLVTQENDEAVEVVCPSCDYTDYAFKCPCGSGKTDTWWEHDAQGIPLCKVCEECRDKKLSVFRPEILEGYTQADVDERIDEDEI